MAAGAWVLAPRGGLPALADVLIAAVALTAARGVVGRVTPGEMLTLSNVAISRAKRRAC